MRIRTESISYHLSLSENVWHAIVSFGISLLFLGAQGVSLAGDGSADNQSRTNYALILEITAKEGSAERFSFVSAGGRFEASFVSGQSDVQQVNVGITTSLVLTVGKTVTLREDGRQRIRLTVNKVSD